MKKLFATLVACMATVFSFGQNVGIGTSSPAHKLHVTGGDIFLQSSSGKFRFGYAGSNEWQMATTNAGADLRWYITTDGGVNFTPRHYFSQNGNVGIGGFSGVQAPNARLEIIGEGATSSTNVLLLRNSNGDTLWRFRNDGRMGIGYNGTTFGRTMNLGGTGINFYTTNEAAFGGAVFPTDTSLVIWANSNSNNYLVLQPSWGNTGVGTYTPNAKFHVNGAMLIGSNSARIATGYALSVDGNIICEDVVELNSTAWPDYVFENDYPLLSLEQLEKTILQQKHLPKIPSADQVKAKGVSMATMNRGLLEKVEELTLYIIQLNKDNKRLAERVARLEDKQ
ncbi:MAG TPA: hypothetical protein VLC98_09805 [Phnomibacter sp.]|nr:hypothetical protein [Phnomibacter sp.]